MLETVHATLLAQAVSQVLFRTRCCACHGSAAELDREPLVRRAGILSGERSRLPVDAFLRHHRDLSSEEARFSAGVLNRVEAQVGR